MLAVFAPEVDQQDGDADDQEGVGNVEDPGPEMEAAGAQFDLEKVADHGLVAGGGVFDAGVTPGVRTGGPIAQSDPLVILAQDDADAH